MKTSDEMRPNQSMKRSLSRHLEDTMDYDSDDKDSKRKSRNLSEKKRRDQFNLLVNELSSMISTTGRKMDKSTVLKSTISFLKNHNVAVECTMKSRVNEIQENWKPTFLTNEEFIHLILEAVDGFIIVFSTSGQIFYASQSITGLLGHLPNDVVEMSLYDLTVPEDKGNLYNVLSNPLDVETPLSFSCHLRRGTLRSHDPTSYELVQFVGYFRPDGDAFHENDIHGYSEEPEECRYLPFELLGTSGYEYYHVDDLENVINCHKALMQKGEGTSCPYRFLTKGQQWIWLQTRYFITYHQWNSKPEFVVCTNQVVSYTEVAKQAKKDWKQPVDNNDFKSIQSGDILELKTKQRPGSDCISMTADSPGSFGPQQNIVTENLDNVVGSQFQADLQKKQTELQMIIDQQQQELRRVSEQLLMVKLGFMQQQQQIRGTSPQPSTQVSSTTTARTGSVIVPSTQHAHAQMQQQNYLPDSNSNHI